MPHYHLRVSQVTILSWLMRPLRRWLSEGDDPAWRPTGRTQRYAGYEQWRAVASAKRARTRTPTGRNYQLKGEIGPIRKVK